MNTHDSIYYTYIYNILCRLMLVYIYICILNMVRRVCHPHPVESELYKLD